MIVHAIQELKPGMVLAKSVYDFHEVLLLKAGTALTSQNIRLLKSWGVAKVQITGEEHHSSDKKDTQHEKRIQETVEKYLLAKFEGVLDDPVMQVIMEAAGALITQRYTNRAQENETD